MPRGEEPLLARPPSEHSQDEDMAEEDALLTGQPTARQQSQARFKKWREVGAFVWAFAATVAVIVLAVVFQHQQIRHRDHASAHGRPSGKRNLVFMVSDGMGPTTLSLTRGWRQYNDGLPWSDALVLDEHLIGQSRTRSSSSLVTDSAAGATAFSCGQKTYNGAISVLPDHSPCGSLMEAAKRAGYTTGLVVTTRVTDATPAVWVSHVRRRDMEDEIAEQMVGLGPLGRNVDLVLGGGRCHFVANGTEGSCRSDEHDLIGTAEDEGWNYISTRKDFDALQLGSAVKLPLLGLFAPGDIPFEIDRRYEEETYPSLEEMAKTALRALSAATKDSEQGFFVMIEGSRIDHAGHNNDGAAQVHEVMAYDRTMQAVLDFLDEQETPGLMISTSDHETGGLAISRQLNGTYPDYLWYPSVLSNANHSAEYTTRRYRAHLATLAAEAPSTSPEEVRSYLTELVGETLGIHDVAAAELDLLLEYPVYVPWIFADMVARRARLGWSTHGHSAADVNIYASDRRAARELQGNHENTEVGEFLRWYLDLDDEVKAVTKELREKLHTDALLGKVPVTGERLDSLDHLDHYFGDLKRWDADGRLH